ncbi:SH3 domain-containing protein [bacterium]|nr:SH3 domain-containing protein [bacterium]MBU1959514.1 SH3 domain-containing protein [bacterium]
MKKFLFLPLITLFIFTSCQEIGDNKPLLSNTKKRQPIVIVNKNRHLNIAEFWIDKIEKPDTIIMNEKEIEHFNNDTAYNKKTLNNFQDINKIYGSEWIKEKLLQNFNGLKSRATYFADGYKIPLSFYNDIKQEMNLNDFHETNRSTRYALTINYSNQKIIPTELSLHKKNDEIHFDRNQNSALDIATPIAILHSSIDGAWHYGIGPTSSGWVRSKDIAFGERDEILNYVHAKNFVITTAAKTPLMIRGKYHDYLRMGVRLPTVMNIDDMTMVLVPIRDEKGNLILSNATLKTEHVHKGYLPYTQRTILTQAFKFIHAPYGWGGMYGEQDCSKFLQEIYATTGIKLPRNSASQSNVGQAKLDIAGISKNSKYQFLKNSALAGVTIIHLQGHIVLYVGEYKDEPYIIHTVWGSSAEHYALGRTAVTSLNFNNYLNKIDMLTDITLR